MKYYIKNFIREKLLPSRFADCLERIVFVQDKMMSIKVNTQLRSH